MTNNSEDKTPPPPSPPSSPPPPPPSIGSKSLYPADQLQKMKEQARETKYIREALKIFKFSSDQLNPNREAESETEDDDKEDGIRDLQLLHSRIKKTFTGKSDEDLQTYLDQIHNALELCHTSKRRQLLQLIMKTIEDDPDFYSKRIRLEPPDGGWGWMVLFGCVLTNFLLPGFIKSFGVLFVEFLEKFESSEVMASMIPALSYFLYHCLGPVSNYLSRKYSCRTVILVAGALASFGLIASFFATSLVHLCITCGFLFGCGTGLAYPLGILIVTSYFKKYRGLANGIAISGSAFGSVLLPPFLNYMIESYGVHGAVLIMGAITMNVWVGGLLYHPVAWHMKQVLVSESAEHSHMILHQTKVDEDKFVSREKVDLESGPEGAERQSSRRRQKYTRQLVKFFGTPTFLMILVSVGTTTVGYANFAIFLPAYAISLGYDKAESSLLLSVVSIFDLIGRIGGPCLSDHLPFGKKYYFIAGITVSGISLVFVPLVRSYYVLSWVCAIFGFASGIFNGVYVVTLIELLGEDNLASSYITLNCVYGILHLVGPPACGLFYRAVKSLGVIIGMLGGLVTMGGSIWILPPLLNVISH